MKKILPLIIILAAIVISYFLLKEDKQLIDYKDGSVLHQMLDVPYVGMILELIIH